MYIVRFFIKVKREGIIMTVLSQDKKIIFTGKIFSVEKNLGGKDKKYAIVGSGKDGFASKVLAYYADEKTAVDELEKLFDAMANGQKAYALEN